ncbi:cobalt-precorrin-6A reductase [Nocardia sp. NPDC005366]|uniref:cobalt-precorrin-6A reductase n=1 Tax=Nocardia sp. NPDC005366 TaxID=3156878 RepID=UPI0033ABF676
MRVLILGGSREARELAHATAGERGLEIVSSLAGRVRDPHLPVGQVRIGGFGGADALRDWLAAEDIAAVVNATHPFAARIGANTAVATAALGIPLLRVLRPAWSEQPGDRWIRVADLDAAARTLSEFGDRVFLTIGRQGVGAFAALSRQWFLIRAIDPPDGALPPHHELLLARGPFALEDEIALLSEYRVDVVVTKDSGGDQTEAKLVAARAAGLPVIVIDRPALPPGVTAVDTVEQARDWLLRMVVHSDPESAR